MRTINPLSIASFYTEIFSGNNMLGTATSFAYLYKNQKYLVTNYHVAFGVNPANDNILDEKLRVPNNLKCHYYTPKMELKCYEINYQDINSFKFIILNETKVDIAICKLPDDVNVVCINNLESISELLKYESEILFEITETLYVLGYPRGINISNTPIWKQSSIASEPELDICGLPCFYIDSTTREGMSGAPVIFYSINGDYKTPNTQYIASGQTYAFVGIYSGRDSEGEPHIAQLGKVWKKELIEKIIEENFEI